MGCRGICDRHGVKQQIGCRRYEVGQKRCQICSRYVIMDGLYCYCCGQRLRLKPHNSGNQAARMRAKMKAERDRMVQKIRDTYPLSSMA